MKTRLVLLVLTMVAISCNNKATVTIQEDSLKNEVKREEQKVDSSAGKLEDSVKDKWKELKDEVEKKVENTDTVNK